MDTGLKGKVAVVTGGSSGIGLAAAQLFLEEGASVAICGRDSARLDTAEAELGKIGEPDRVLSAVCDVTDKTAVSAFRDQVRHKFGRCDALVCNAGQARRSNLTNTTDDGLA